MDSGKSVIVIAHHQAVMAHADWIIDLGPGAGHDGGRVVFEGTPAELVAARSTLTGQHLGGLREHRGLTSGSRHPRSTAGASFDATIWRPTPSATRSMSKTVCAHIMWTSRWMRCSSLSR